MPYLIAVAGPLGSGKTTWLKQFLSDRDRQIFYGCPGICQTPVDLARIGYCFPWVQVLSEAELPLVLSTLPPQAVVYLELGFHLDLMAPPFQELPGHRIAVLPPQLQDSEWHYWADEIIPGHDLPLGDPQPLPALWHTALTGQVFDPPSLDTLLLELTDGAYGKVQRVKGIFEVPNGQAFYIDFVQGLAGIEYTELALPLWLEGRPQRFSGLEVVGWHLETSAILATLKDSALSDQAIAQYQERYRTQQTDTEVVPV